MSSRIASVEFLFPSRSLVVVLLGLTFLFGELYSRKSVPGEPVPSNNQHPGYGKNERTPQIRNNKEETRGGANRRGLDFRIIDYGSEQDGKREPRLPIHQPLPGRSCCPWLGSRPPPATDT